MRYPKTAPNPRRAMELGGVYDGVDKIFKNVICCYAIMAMQAREGVGGVLAELV